MAQPSLLGYREIQKKFPENQFTNKDILYQQIIQDKPNRSPS
ncbi:9876_t:CDS:1, partial [Dentiscutata heterogama]